ncbi:Lsr2 dimerization domain-containing protein [Amycolatopsis rifamycinica]|uniref:Lsr2 dimerization domain-containing protein n=1 Tax=Amycolatopsis rifamycinica TaxID=287986 RepID=UPI0005C17B6B|nr:histone-like nucleoid-structuring protein Lsr2 [Amycolatopsis rifamycinica]
MARNTAVRVLDDLTGEPAAETVGFGLDGIEYDIDLSFANAEALREFLQRYADAGRRTGGRKNRPRIVPGAKKTPPKPATAKTTKAAPVKTKAAAVKKTEAEPAKTKAAAAKTAKAEPAKTTRTRKAAEPKATTRATARKVPTVTFSAAE